MSLVAATYGEFGTTVGPRIVGTATRNDPAAADKPAAPTMAPSRPLHDEPGSNAGGLSLASITANPTTWLVVTIGLAVVAARVAKTGRVW